MPGTITHRGPSWSELNRACGSERLLVVFTAEPNQPEITGNVIHLGNFRSGDPFWVKIAVGDKTFTLIGSAPHRSEQAATYELYQQE